MKVALESFATTNNNSKTVILGDMFELGSESLKEHQKIVDLATKLHFNTIFFVGENFHLTKTTGLKFKGFEDFFNFIKNNPLKQQSILIKGSRGMALERILAVIN
jgi:UDP-N-acetylmuramoyl-tripeptide--D-alanyl-D-alanine ligase